MLDAAALRKHWSTTCAVVVSAIALAVMGWRMLQGFDLNDESFYVAIPARFAMGDRPFVDDLSVAQTAGLLLYPFVKAYLAIAGTTGIFLFLRVLYLVFFACVGWSAYALAKPHVPRPAALLLGVACLCFLPYSLPGLGYNTLSLGLLAIALFSNARWLLAEEPARPFWRTPVYWAGLALAAATFAYPTQALTTVASVAALVALARGRRLRALAMTVAGGATFALLMMPVLAGAGLTQLRAMVQYTSGDSPSSGFSPAVIADRLATFAGLHPELPLAAGLAVAAALAVRWLPRATALPMLLFPLVATGSVMTGYLGSLGFVAGLGAVAPLLALGVAARRPALVLAIAVALPSWVAGLVWSLSSGNGALAAGVGLFPAAIVAGLLLAMFVDRPALGERLRPALSLSPAVLVALLLHYATGEDLAYGEALRGQLTERISEGPFWGLSTSPQKAKVVRELTADLRAYRGPPGSRLYHNVPASYLIAERPPLVAATWIFPTPVRVEIDAAAFITRARPGDLILLGPEPNPLLSQFIKATSEPLAQRETYAVLRHRGLGHLAAAAPPPTAALPLDQWRELGGKESDALMIYGWSWAEGWGRWSASRHAGLALPLPAPPHGGANGDASDLVVKLDVLAHVARQRYKIRAGETLLAEGVVPAEGAVIELAMPARLSSAGALYLSFELPDARPAEDGRLAAIGLRRALISRKPGG